MHKIKRRLALLLLACLLLSLAASANALGSCGALSDGSLGEKAGSDGCLSCGRLTLIMPVRVIPVYPVASLPATGDAGAAALLILPALLGMAAAIKKKK